MTDSTPVPQTAVAFGYPDTLVGETAEWLVLARPKQVTLGSLVLVCRQPVQAFSDIGVAAFTDLHAATTGIERVLTDFTGYEKINYLMLMMVDPDVHFHVIPRYAEARDFAGQEFPDVGWPGPPALAEAVVMEGASLTTLVDALRSRWAQATAHSDS